ncbi:hypothetical protein [Flavobacterium subsaxonicum]|uniref:Lipoprotein n=1 Tax=Flavobacterium subsaxonicum WB 4.1-42 = DSM 21790 TaxID=1121898 RepID=A0A0A2MWU1_9FLAO|nr:hypothetical protein [Flavobacterium subsaxonicum]KGO92655.1 hypothetical protein Q766_11055 [Flavobacterium subsaxonicum WB 4.1-42 = DSM 21790]
MKKIILLFAVLIIVGCKKSEGGLELTVENDTIIASSDENGEYVNIIKFSITNNSDDHYYINNNCHDGKICETAVYSDGVNLRIYNRDNTEIKYNHGHFTGGDEASDAYYLLLKNAMLYEKSLGYEYPVDYYRQVGFKNFFIYSGETIYFEYPLNINKAVGYEAVRVGLITLDKNKHYKATVSMFSDSTRYKDVLPRDILKTLKANNIKVYHGDIKSNKLPVKVMP